MNELVSVIIAVHNGERTLPETIRSILGQTYKYLEVVLVDDGSTDKSVEVIKSFKDVRIRLFEQKNSGSPASPRNLGIKKAQGEFIALCDQDDIWYKDKLEVQMSAYRETNGADVGIIYSSMDLVDRNGNKVGHNLVSHPGCLGPKEARRHLLSVNNITACSAVIPKKVLEEIGDFDTGLRGVDDYDLWLRISKKYGILGVKKTLGAWRVDTRSLSANKTAQYLETEKIFENLGDSGRDVKVGHGKNLTRIFLSSMTSRNFTTATRYRKEAEKYPISVKISIIFGLSKISDNLGYFVVILLKKMGRVVL